MSQPQGCNDDSDVIERFTEALKQRVGGERFQIWFSGINFECFRGTEGKAGDGRGDAELSIVAIAGGQFAADRLSKHYLSEMRGAAAAACGKTTSVRVQIDTRPVKQVELPLEADDEPSPMREPAGVRPEPARKRRGGKKQTAQSLQQILRDGTDSRKSSQPTQPRRTAKVTLDPGARLPGQTVPESPERRDVVPQSLRPSIDRDAWTWESFVAGSCNELARAACKMAIDSPSLASPLVLWGPPGSG